MRLSAILLATASLTLAAPAFADEGGKPKPGGQYVDLAPLALPVVVDGRVVNYVFVSIRVNLSASANGPKLQEREPYFRDALVRAGHRAPFTRYDDYTRLDDDKLRAAMFTASVAIAGPGQVTSITILSETAKQHSGLPRPRIAPTH